MNPVTKQMVTATPSASPTRAVTAVPRKISLGSGQSGVVSSGAR